AGAVLREHLDDRVARRRAVVDDDLGEHGWARSLAPGRGTPHALGEELVGLDLARAHAREIPEEAGHGLGGPSRPRPRVTNPEEVDGLAALLRVRAPARTGRPRVHLRAEDLEAARRDGRGDPREQAGSVLRDDADLADLGVTRRDEIRVDRDA